ncbi:MAG: T9SS type A sorting domain-containing protein [Flavobacteriales bacterium]|nr:T9SS type A sorting domain-containing protein [Flavobacteriales bacterium]
MARYWIDGARDSVYPVPDPKVGDGQAFDFHVFPDGRVLKAGNFWLHDTLRGFVAMDYGLVWLNNDGSLDTTRIHRRINLFGAITRIQELPDGRFICGGGGGLFEGDSISDFVFRIHADGSLDTTFHAPWMDYGAVIGILPQSDGKILVSGVFHIAGDPDTLGLVRLLPDGTMDVSFNNHMDNLATYESGVTRRQGVLGVLPIGSNMLAITGGFDQIDGQTRGGIAMLDTAGHLLPGFFEGNGCGAWYSWPNENGPYKHIKGIELAQDGGYFIYGSYSGYDDGVTNDPSQRFISKLYGLNVGIQEHGAHAEPLQIAPNPSAGQTELSVGTPPQKGTLSIHDASGRMVLQEVWPAGAYTHTLRAGALAPGTYVVRVASNASTLYSGKLIVLP